MATTHLQRLAASTCGIAIAALVFIPPRASTPSVVGLSTSTEAAQLPESDLWLASSTASGGSSELSRGIALLTAGRAAEASPIFARAASDSMLGGYARLYLGRAALALGRGRDAADAARGIIGTSPSGYLGEAALWLLADGAEATGAWQDAFDALGALKDLQSSNPSLALLRFARAAEKTGDLSAARSAFARVYYDYPLSAEAPAAGSALTRLPAAEGPELYKQQFARAQALFTGRRYADARKAYEEVRGRTTGDDRVLVDLRLAECDYGLQRFQAAYDQVRGLVDRAGPLRAEVEFYAVSALRGLKKTDEYPAKVAAFVGAHPTDPLAELALNELATAYILANDDASAATVFTEMYARFPLGAYADRAAWKAGWYAYRTGKYREAIRLFEPAVTNQPRADYRPSWLYWTARAYEQVGEPEAALTWYRRTVADYRNSYYGRQATTAMTRLTSRRPGPSVALAAASRPARLVITPGNAPANAALIQRLLSTGLYDDAIFELRKLQRDSGSSPLIEATIAYALNRKGELRPAITAMRRAYPQFMAEGGESLPRAILTVIFPVNHQALLFRYAAGRQLDPYLLLAQVAQESTFQADVRSPANAYGLMQLLPSTAHRYAPKVGLRTVSIARLTDPETNVRLGTQYFADLIAMFGGDTAPALAAYNAGENRVSRWRAERPGINRDEFIDDIPFPETQNYVKRILGTAEDYRILYGEGARTTRPSPR